MNAPAIAAALLFSLTLFFSIEAQPQPAWTPTEEAVLTRFRGIRSLPADKRSEATRALALEIHNLMTPGQLRLATNLASMATEGDLGKPALQEVANTLAAALERKPPPPDKPGSPATPYLLLAELIRYEGVSIRMANPQLKAAFSKLDDNDKSRQNANFTLKDITGKSWTFKGLHGSVVIVNFWATWCPPCRKEMPDLEALYKRFHKSGLVVLSITDEPETKAKSYVADKHYTYPILSDPSRKVHDMFVVEGIPRSFVFNREGKLTGQAHDMRTLSQFLQMLHEAGVK